ncbi:hypothetical protein [Rhodococcoides fascians]|uniref:hypothetical protein n=1 Tax=Rhodococcoides fascians TaxID=1828 RepID=UPI00055F4472|nr:hypothetical protein [Rhodococcus fascians]
MNIADTTADLRNRALIMVARFSAVHANTPNAKGVDTAERLAHFIDIARSHGATDRDIAGATA